MDTQGQALLMKVRKHIIELADSWLGLPSKEVEYLDYNLGYSYMRDTRDNLLGQQPWWFAIWFVQDEVQDVGAREVATVSDGLANLGGFMEVISLGVLFLIGHFQEFFFFTSIFPELFTVQGGKKGGQ